VTAVEFDHHTLAAEIVAGNVHQVDRSAKFATEPIRLPDELREPLCDTVLEFLVDEGLACRKYE
jgi:hypothetical protein